MIAAVALAVLAACGFALGRLAPGGAGMVTIAVAAALAAVSLPGDALVPAVLAAMGPWLMGRALAARDRLVDELDQQARRLEAEEERYAALAVQRERARIARELHDIVAHHLTVIVVQAGAGRMAAPAGASQRLADIRSAATGVLDELTQLTDVLAPGPTDLRERLRAVYERARAAGLEVCAGPPPPVPADLADTVHRVVQEALTNAIKHAPGTRVEVTLEAAAERVRVDIRDEGARHPSGLHEAGAGAGLAGMRARVEALGGRLDAGPAQDGWTVSAELPTSAGVREVATSG